MGVPVVLGLVALAPAEWARVPGRRVAQQLAARLVAVRVWPAVAARVVVRVWPPAVRVVRAVQLRAVLRLRRVPVGKTTAGLRCRARASRAASRPGRRAWHLKFHAPID